MAHGAPKVVLGTLIWGSCLGWGAWALEGAELRRLPLRQYRDKMAAGWIGQMAGVGWGGPTEFRYVGQIIPENEMPAWKPEMINQFHQDDLYVEMTFLRTLEQYGLDCSIRQAGIDFANSGYPLWHANRAGRDNLRAGIAPPDSGHPKFNAHADDIDYQIEADFSGLIAPGMPNTVIELGEKFGRLMNYGDGLYGGQFVGGMYAAAFFESEPVRLVEAGLRCIPENSQYAECIRDVLQWYRQEPEAWQKTWQKIEAKYNLDPLYRRASCMKGKGNIDAKINGAYIVMGLLYGKGDLDQTIIISTRCGQDSDCNPSSAAGVIFTTVGMTRLPQKFTSALDRKTVFSHTAYDVDRLLAVSEKLARQAVVRAGGRIEQDPDQGEVFVIPVQQPKPSRLEQCWEPGPVAGSRFTPEEMAKIKVPEGKAKRTSN
ncbi:MAG: ADP-ribosylglycohydrolase family protein [Thermoguttaceae bacterium]